MFTVPSLTLDLTFASVISMSPGEYFLQAYDNYKSDPEIIYSYFPGSWNPYQHSVDFSEIVGPIEVRRNWDIEGININFK